MKARITRRQFAARTFLAASGIVAAPGFLASGKISPNEKLNVGVIGTAHRGASNLQGVSGENVAALCDVDDGLLAAAHKHHPQAKTYNDFRKLIEQPDLDAIVVSTPDHVHAVATMMALKNGRHVYCEKPLTRTLSECRAVTEAARRLNQVTQIGTQIHAEPNYRRVVELIQTGAIGEVSEVHVWSSVTYNIPELPAQRPTVPANLHYDLWLGPVPERPYYAEYLPKSWRHWWAFGGGGLGDFGCHYMDLPFWALGLRTPLSVEPIDGPPVQAEAVPPWMIVRWEFPSPNGKGALPFTWYHGGKFPAALGEERHKTWKNGVLFIGAKGMLLADYRRHELLPEDKFKDFAPPPQTIPASIGHHQEWIQAIKHGGKPLCHFDYSGPLTETVHLGNVAYRVGKKLLWDAPALRAKNCPEADQFIQHQYRKGWSL